MKIKLIQNERKRWLYVDQLYWLTARKEIHPLTCSWFPSVAISILYKHISICIWPATHLKANSFRSDRL